MQGSPLGCREGLAGALNGRRGSECFTRRGRDEARCVVLHVCGRRASRLREAWLCRPAALSDECPRLGARRTERSSPRNPCRRDMSATRGATIPPLSFRPAAPCFLGVARGRRTERLRGTLCTASFLDGGMGGGNARGAGGGGRRGFRASQPGWRRPGRASRPGWRRPGRRPAERRPGRRRSKGGPCGPSERRP